MELELSQRNLDYIVQQLRLALRKDIKAMLADTQQPDFITTAEAAIMRGVSTARMRQLARKHPELYPHTKTGDSKQATLLFDRNALLRTLK
ncbi:MAG: hypothetical protein IJU19_00620 [Bacteroidales bacterium]|nr:hypothetical protein [Bacteroidales bacterium]